MPFLLWDVIYTVKNVLFGDNVEWKSVLFDFLTGRAAAPLYYILVLFQLTLLTPFILKKAGKKWLYLITPVYLCLDSDCWRTAKVIWNSFSGMATVLSSGDRL